MANGQWPASEAESESDAEPALPWLGLRICIKVALEAASVKCERRLFCIHSHAAWHGMDVLEAPEAAHLSAGCPHTENELQVIGMQCLALPISRTHVTLSRIKRAASSRVESPLVDGQSERAVDAVRPLKCTLLESFVMLIKAASSPTTTLSLSLSLSVRYLELCAKLTYI